MVTMVHRHVLASVVLDASLAVSMRVVALALCMRMDIRRVLTYDCDCSYDTHAMARRYFVTHFKSCHLKNLLYRFNGHSEEENMRVRFGPRRKKDANQWFGQLKSTEKRMVRKSLCHY